MLSSNFSRFIFAHYFKYNNIFEKKRGGLDSWTPTWCIWGCFFFFTCQKVQKDAIESEYAISSLNQIISLLRWLNNFIFTTQNSYNAFSFMVHLIPASLYHYIGNYYQWLALIALVLHYQVYYDQWAY